MSAEIDFFSPTSSVFLANKRFFTEFLDQDDEESKYEQRITTMLQNGQTRLLINLDDLRAYNLEIAQKFLNRPMEYFAPWQSALCDFIKTLPAEDSWKSDLLSDFRIGVDGSFGGQKVDPRQLKSKHVGQLMVVEGIATKCSLIRPKVTNTVHFCEATKAYSTQTFHDATSITGFPTGSAYPTKDENENPLETEFGLSYYVDYQTLCIQEMPEKAPAGLLPKSVDVVLDADLVDSCKPGDRVKIAGIYRTLPNKSEGGTSGNFRTVLIACSVAPVGKEKIDTELTEMDIRNIRKIAKDRKDVFELMASSIAPSIFGHSFIKKSLVLLLLGGVEKNLDNGTHIRGDINLLMVGDPSTAKSQLLRFVLNTAPLALNTTGKGSSGVGLTAAVTQDRETGERRLEAGAMVLADRGIVCIDEFDKMSDSDRVSIHEVMEQQTVTIAKAGIRMSLNARCSVVAAANPAYGQYDNRESPATNVAMPDSLLSRFDLLFIVLDDPDPSKDAAIADKVLANHRYMGKAPGDDMDDGDEQEREETPVYQKYDKLLHGTKKKKGKPDILTNDFLRKYIKFARSEYEPILTEEAADFIGTCYANIRSRAMNERALPITPRALETLIRLSSAHAKCRLSKKVTKVDVEAIMEIMKFALENDGTTAKETEEEEDDAVNGGGGGDDDDDDEDGDDGEEEKKEDELRDVYDYDENVETAQATKTPTKRKTAASPSSANKRARKTPSSASKKIKSPAPKAKTPAKSPSTRTKSPRRVAPVASPALSQRTLKFQLEVAKYFRANKKKVSLPLSELLEAINKEVEVEFSEAEATEAIEKMAENNKVMFTEGEVWNLNL